MCRLDSSNGTFYVLEISTDNHASIWKHEGDDWTKLAGSDDSYIINDGSATNHIRADCIGKTLTLYANGQEILEAKDSEFDSGEAGLLVESTEASPGVEVSFDSFLVSTP